MIYIAADHAGLKLKEKIKKYLDSKKIKYQDLGSQTETKVDASDYAVKVAQKVKENNRNKGILICGSGVMMSIAANRVKGIRAVLSLDQKITKLARQHDNVNVLCLPSRDFKEINWLKIVDTFLETKKLNKQRYLRRIKKLDKIKI